MKRILAFGDSLTWGHDPVDGTRHAKEVLWPNVLARHLGVEVISEALGGRTTVFDDDTGPCDRNGSRVLPIILHSHSPLDLVIIMLGTNDLKPANGTKAEDATKGIRRLIEIVRSQDYGVIGTVPDLLIVAPPPCVVGPDGVTGSGRDLEQTRLLAPMYQALSRELGVAFFDAGEVAAASPLDGVHLDAANTAAIGTALGAFLQSSQNA